eukprot:9917-Heterococcus_DN1.PRE.6
MSASISTSAPSSRSANDTYKKQASVSCSSPAFKAWVAEGSKWPLARPRRYYGALSVQSVRRECVCARIDGLMHMCNNTVSIYRCTMQAHCSTCTAHTLQ